MSSPSARLRSELEQARSDRDRAVAERDRVDRLHEQAVRDLGRREETEAG